MAILGEILNIFTMKHSYIPDESEQESEAQVEQGDAEEEEENNGDSE